MAKRVLVVDDDASITRHLGTARVGALWLAASYARFLAIVDRLRLPITSG